MKRDSPCAWWLTGRKAYRVQYGGRGGGKTYSATEALVYLMMVRRLRILCVRAVQKSIAKSVKPELERWIRWRGVEAHFDIKQESIVCTLTGSEAMFHGADKQTVESIRSIAAGVGITFIEEAHQIPAEVWDVMEPSLRPERPGQHVELWACFNPTREHDPIYAQFVEQRKGEEFGDLAIKEVNWYDNPWFPERLNRLRLHAKKHFPKALYEHIWLGKLHPGESKRGWYPLVERRQVRACMDPAWWAKRPEARGEGKPTLGHDVAQPDTRNNALVVRHGPVVEWAEKFGAESWDGVGLRAKAVFDKYGCNHAFVDATGVGQGAVSQYGVLGLRWRPVNFGEPPRGKKRSWLPSTSNADMFSMRNVQLAWTVKVRIENTWRAQQGEAIDPRLCMFVNPDIPERDLFAAEVAQPTWTQIAGEKAMKLDKYGGDDSAKSPDLFDALCLAFAMDSVSGLRASDWNQGVA